MRLGEHLGQTHQATDALRKAWALGLAESTPRAVRSTTAESTENPLRQAQSDHGKQLDQNSACDQWHNDQHENFHWVLAGIAIDVTEEALYGPDHALNEALARPSSSRGG